MINLKKTLLFILLFNCVFFTLNSQEKAAESETKVERSIEESDIVLTDDDSFYYDQENDPQNKGSSSISIFIRMLVVLIIVIALLYFIFYFVKKKTNFVKNDDDYLRRAAYINIAPGKTVEVITLIDKAYLIGVTEDNITLLGEIKDDELIKAMNITSDKKNNVKKPSTFTDVLDMFTLKNKNKNVFEDVENNLDDFVKKAKEETNESDLELHHVETVQELKE